MSEVASKRSSLASMSSMITLDLQPTKLSDSVSDLDLDGSSIDESVISGRKNNYSSVHGIRAYPMLVRNNINYRFYLISHLCQHAGDWFVNIASLIVIERLAPRSSLSISILVASRLLPNVIFSPFGGALADSYDRRKIMIALDLCSAFVVLGYLIAISAESTLLLYTVSFVRNSIVSIYEPVTRSMVPLLVPNDEDLKRAVTLNGLAWSAMLTLGGTVAGISAAYFGVEVCYILDSFTYFLSAAVMTNVKGNFSVAKNRTDKLWKSRICWKITVLPLIHFVTMMVELVKYLWVCGFGILVFMKLSGIATEGVADILNVNLSHVEGDEAATSKRLGVLYSCTGIGCMIGPIIANCFTDISKPMTLQLACIAALAIEMASWIGMAYSTNRHFGFICACSAIRSIGSSIVWIYSTLLLQKLCAREVLGRVLSFEFSSAMLCEAFAALISGLLRDANMVSKEIAFGASAVMFILCILWSLYHACGKGAARTRFNSRDNKEGTEEIAVQCTFA